MKLVINGEVVEVSGGGGATTKPVRHMVIFEESGVFNPADYGLGAGDTVNVTVVGGGEGGYGSGSYSGTDAGVEEKVYHYGRPGYGYGAGGGGPGNVGNENGTRGGNGGEIQYTSVVLPNANPIPVTIGPGGTGGSKGTYFPTAGGTSSFGAYVTALGGKSFGSDTSGSFNGGEGAGKGLTGLSGEGPLAGRGGRANLSTNAGGGGGGGSGYMPQGSSVESGPLTMVQKGSGVVIVEWFG